MSHRASSNWTRIRLGDHAWIRGRIGWKGLKADEYTEDGPYLIAGNHILGNKVQWDECQHISWYRYDESPEIQLKKGDVIISKDGTIGRVAYIDLLPHDSTINSTMMLVRVWNIEVLKPEFFFYYLQGETFNQLVAERISGSSVPHLFQADMKEFEIDTPLIDEQQKIAEILTTIDNLIEQTQAATKKCQAIKQGMMQDLFSRGIDMATGKLRPTRVEAPELYQETTLEWLPKDWSPKTLKECTKSDVTYGIVQAGPHIEGGVPYIRTGDMSGDELIKDQLLCTSEKIANSYKRSEVRAGEIVCAIRATVGKVLKVPKELDGANLTQGTARISPSDQMNSDYLLWAMRSDSIEAQIRVLIKGTTFMEITLEQLRRIMIPKPKIEEQKIIAQKLNSIQKTVRDFEKNKAKLAQLKQGLMQDLLTGKVRVPLNESDMVKAEPEQ